MPVITTQLKVIGKDEVQRAMQDVADAYKHDWEMAKAVTEQMEKQRLASLTAAAAEEARGRLGAQASQRNVAAMQAVETRTVSLAEKADVLASRFAGVARDVDSVAGESAANFARWTNDILGTAAALGTGGLAGAASIASIVAGGAVALYAQWNSEIVDHKKRAEEAAAAEKKWLEDTTALVKKTTDELKRKTAEELYSLLVVQDLRKAHIAEERVLLVAQLSATKADSEERVRIRAQLSENTARMAEAVVDREKTAAERSKAIERDAIKERNGAEIDLQKEREERAKAAAAAKEKHDAEGQAALDRRARKFEADEKASLLLEQKTGEASLALLLRENETYLRMVVDAQQRVDEIHDLGRQRDSTIDSAALAAKESSAGHALYVERIALLQKEAAAQDHEDREKARRLRTENAERLMAQGLLRLTEEEYAKLETEDDDLTKAKIANRKAQTDAAVAALRREALASQAAAAAEYGQAAAMAAMSPVTDALTEKLRELGDVNRENFGDFANFTQEMPALMAKWAQAQLAGIAIYAVGKSAAEVAEAVGAGAAATFAFFTPGGQATAAGYAKSAAEHLASAGLWAALAGGAAVGAGAIGSQRGEGGIVGLTSAERKSMSTRGASGTSGGHGPALGGNSEGGGDTYFVFNYEAGAIDSSQKDQRNRTVQAAQRDNARDVFAAREIKRAA